MIAFPVEQILHTMNAGYALYEFITDENGQPCDYVFIDINPAFEKLTGFRAVDIVGKRITQILPAADAIHFIERYRPVAFGGQAMAGYFDALPDEIIGKTDFDLLPLTAAKNCRRTDQKALTSGTIVNAEEKVGERIYESVKFPVQLTSGHTGIGAFLKDITANRRNEDYLLQQLTRHSIFERSLTMDFDTLEGQCDYALRQAMHLTECQFGVIHSYAYDEMKSGSDSVNRITRVSHNVDQALLTEQLKDLWQEMIKSPQALIMNDFGSSHSLQLPAGTACCISLKP